MKLILFEMKKLVKSTYFVLLLVILAILISSYFTYNYLHTVRIKDLTEEQDLFITNAKRALDEIEEAIQAGEVKEDSYATESEINYLMESIEEHEKVKAEAIAHDWDTLIDYQIVRGERSLTDEIINLYRWPTDFTASVHYERNKWLKENQLRPVFPIHEFSELTIYDEVFDDFLELEAEVTDFNNIHSSSAVYFLYLLFSLAFGIIGAGFFLFLFGDIITKEGVGRNGSLHLLYTQPVRRGYLFFSKYMTLLIATLLIFISVAGFSLLLGMVFDRFGELQYPVLIYEPERSFYFMPMWKLILLAASLFYMVLIFCYAWLFFFSYITKRTAMAIGLTVTFLFLGVQLSEQIVHTGFAAYNPFGYFHVSDIISMEIAALHNNFELTFYNGLWVLGLASGLILLVTYFISKRHAH